ncbi:hypothetical protein CF326_g2905 [Tilletia indica]|nr:hypothetical protein CF326_g2905 [Tilletia indica]
MSDPIDPIPSSPFEWPSSPGLTLSQQVLHAVIDAAFPIPSDAELEAGDDPFDEPEDDLASNAAVRAESDAESDAENNTNEADASSDDASSDDAIEAIPSSQPIVEDEAEEYDAPPSDGDSSELSSIEGDDCRSEGDRSSDGNDSEGSIVNFVRDDRLLSSSPEPSASDEEEEAVFTQSQASQPRTDVRVELLRALVRPNDEWRPVDSSVSPPSSPSPKRGRADTATDTDGESEDGYVHRPTRRMRGENDSPLDASKGKGKGKGECSRRGKGKARRRSPSPKPKKHKGKGKERHRSPTPIEDNPPSSPGFSGPFAIASTSARPMTSEPRRKASARFRPSIGGSSSSSNHSEENANMLRVVCKWIHDDRISEPLEAWTHQDPSAVQTPGLRLLQARRLSDGTIQLRFFPAQWVSTWCLKLRRSARAPECDGCCDEAP